MSKIHWQISAMIKPYGEQGSVAVRIFKLLFMIMDVTLQVFFTHKKRIDTCTLGAIKHSQFNGDLCVTASSRPPRHFA